MSPPRRLLLVFATKTGRPRYRDPAGDVHGHRVDEERTAAVLALLAIKGLRQVDSLTSYQTELQTFECWASRETHGSFGGAARETALALSKQGFATVPRVRRNEFIGPFELLDDVDVRIERGHEDSFPKLGRPKTTDSGLPLGPPLSDPEILSLSTPPQPWEVTNHSMFDIVLQPVTNPDHRDELASAARTHYGEYVGTIKEIERVAESSGSLNFKISFTDRDPFLLRANMRLGDPRSLESIAALSAHLLERGFLKNSPDRDALLPLRSSSPRPTGCQKVSGRKTDVPLSAYRFVEGSHYSGASTEEMCSVAFEFGLLQSVLADLPPSVNLEPLRHEPLVMDYSVHCSLPEWFREVQEHYSTCEETGQNSDVPVLLLRNCEDIVAAALAALAKSDAEPPERPDASASNPASYIDFHPHNTLLRDGKCALLYDFESCIPQTSQESSLAFAVHRFTRPRIMRHCEQMRTHPQRELVKGFVDRFVSAYKDGGGYVDQPGFEQRLSTHIRATNLTKLFSVYDIVIRKKRKDRTKRPPEVLWAELRKFVAHIQEAAFYERARS